MRAKVSLIAIAFVAAFQFAKAQDNKFNFGLKISPTVAWCGVFGQRIDHR